MISAYNEALHLEATVRNKLAQQYNGSLEVLVASDESTDGTDAILERAAELTGGAALRLVKSSRRRQHLLFDVPVLGLNSIDVMKRTNTTAASFDAGRTLLLDRDQLVARANESGIALIGVAPVE